MRIFYAILKARLREFYRDKASLGWNFIFPFFIIVAFYFTFSGDGKEVFNVGVISEQEVESFQGGFFETNFVHFKKVSREEGLVKVRKHRLDLLIEPSAVDTKYWVNPDSRNGYILEEILKGKSQVPVVRAELKQAPVSYLNWVFPGILAMNIMFNCLWGVGYTIVKYRQDGYLKRLKATPIKAYQFLISQIFARYIIATIVTMIVFFGSKWLIGFDMQGSYFDLFLIFSAGLACLMSIGLLVATRTTSKEFADGVLNLVSWPMMFLSGVWFSMESAGDGMKLFAEFLPLTHMVNGMRAVMVEGASLIDVRYEMMVLTLASVAILALASFLFKWSED